MTLNHAVSILAALLAVAYWWRTVALEFRRHEITFVLQHVLGGISCIYSAYDLWVNGLDVLPVVAPLMAFLYLIRSRLTYLWETGGTGKLDPVTMQPLVDRRCK